jgi:hypothetical protein
MTRFKELLQRLSQHKIDFVLVGGLAAVTHGSAQATSDVDIVYNPDPQNIKKLVHAFQPLHVKLRGKDLPDDLPFVFDEVTFKNTKNFTLVCDLGWIDILRTIPGFDTYQKLLASSDLVAVFDIQLNVLSLDGLIRNKKLCNRPKDQIAVAELEELKKQLKAKI